MPATKKTTLARPHAAATTIQRGRHRCHLVNPVAVVLIAAALADGALSQRLPANAPPMCCRAASRLASVAATHAASPNGSATLPLLSATASHPTETDVAAATNTPSSPPLRQPPSPPASMPPPGSAAAAHSWANLVAAELMTRVRLPYPACSGRRAAWSIHAGYPSRAGCASLLL